MGLDVWFREDVARILAAVIVSRGNLTEAECIILVAICAGFGLSLPEVQLVARVAAIRQPEGDGRE